MLPQILDFTLHIKRKTHDAIIKSFFKVVKFFTSIMFWTFFFFSPVTKWLFVLTILSLQLLNFLSFAFLIYYYTRQCFLRNEVPPTIEISHILIFVIISAGFSLILQYFQLSGWTLFLIAMSIFWTNVLNSELLSLIHANETCESFQHKISFTSISSQIPL